MNISLSNPKSTGGYNRMRWSCPDHGCFNKRSRPKIEDFYHCFPRKVSFGDVDGQVEINGFFAQLEWKNIGAPLMTTGQCKSLVSFSKLFRIGLKWNDFDQLFKNVYIQGNVVFVVTGNAETMEITRLETFWKGVYEDHGTANFERVWTEIKSWSDWAEDQPADPTGSQSWAAARAYEQST